MAVTLTILIGFLLPVLAVGNQFGLFGCPDLSTRTDGSVSYDATGITNTSQALHTRGPFLLYAADEAFDGLMSSCVTMSSGSPSFTITYYMNMTSHQVELKFDNTTGLFNAPLPMNVLGSWTDDSDFKLTLVSNNNGILVFEMCQPTFMAHYITTFIFTDNSIDATALDYKCMMEGIRLDYNIEALPKGVC